MVCNQTSMYSIGYTTGLFFHQFITNKNRSIPSLSSISSAPHLIASRYKNLFEQDQYHVQVIIETLLIAFVIYIIIFIRKKDWKKDMREILSETEKQEIIQEWIANRAPLGMKVSDQELRRISDDNKIVIHQVKGSKIVVTDFSKVDKNKRNNHTNVKNTSISRSSASPSSSLTASGQVPTSTVPTRTMLNMASHDFLGMGSNEDVKEVSSQALKKYGCGACGPRGFYGTIDVHLDLEMDVAKFCDTEAAILYSDGSSCVSSTVAAFSKRGDVLVVDEGIYEALQTGVTLSRSNVHFFKHNDMDDLRRVLEKIKTNDIRIGRKQTDQRRFIVVEGLYKNYGHIAPIDKLVDLKTEFSYRLMVDESFSFGTIGKSGKGVIEHYGKEMMKHVEIVTISIENAIGSVGGVCLGALATINHQRLSGAGYCFSAASPPFTASAGIQALKTLGSQPELVSQLGRNREYLYKLLNEIPFLLVSSDEMSCIALLQLKNGHFKSTTEAALTREKNVDILDEIASICNKKGVLVVSTGHVYKSMHTIPEPAIRLTVTVLHSEEDMQLAVKVLKEAVNIVYEKFVEEKSN